MSELARYAKFARLFLLTIVLVVSSFCFDAAKAGAEEASGKEPVRTTGSALPPSHEPLIAHAPLMSDSQRTGLYLTWGISGVLIFCAVLALVIWVFINTKKGIPEDEDEIADAKPDSKPAEAAASTTEPAPAADGVAAPTELSKPAEAAPAPSESAAAEKAETAEKTETADKSEAADGPEKSESASSADKADDSEKS